MKIHRSRALAARIAVLLASAVMLPGCLGGVQLRSVKSFAALDYSTFKEKFVTVGGVRLCYAELGRGDETIVLLAPAMAPLSVWRDVAPALAKRARVVVVDLPGFGKSDKPPRFRYHPDTFAQVVARFLDAINVSSATLVGNSNGGGTALAFGLRYPGRTRRLVLISPTGAEASPPFVQRALRWGVAPRTLNANPYTARAAWNVAVFEKVGPRTDAFISDLLSVRGAGLEYEAWMRAQIKTLRNTITYDASPRLRELKVPTLIVWGEKDRVLRKRLGEILRKGIAGSELVVLPGIGHIPALEAPDATARLIDGFLARTKPSPASRNATIPSGAAPGAGSPDDEKDDDKDDDKESKE